MIFNAHKPQDRLLRLHKLRTTQLILINVDIYCLFMGNVSTEQQPTRCGDYRSTAIRIRTQDAVDPVHNRHSAAPSYLHNRWLSPSLLLVQHKSHIDWPGI